MGTNGGKYAKADREKANLIIRSKSAGNIGGTTWTSEGTVRRKQPFMMGGSFGWNQYAFPPDQVTSRGETPREREEREKREQESEFEFQEGESERRRERERKREWRKTLKETSAAMREAGKILENYRIFLVPSPKKDWEERAKKFGYSLEEIDLHFSDFGLLLLLPVIEKCEGERLELKEPMTDRDGYDFWLTERIKESTSRVFGWVDWKPLTVAQAKEFGVEMEE